MISINTKKILIPYDFSRTAEKAIRHGAFIAKLFKGEVVLLHVQRRATTQDIILPEVDMGEVSFTTEILEEKLENIAEKIAKDYGIDVTPMVSNGNIASEIVDIAEEVKAGLIVMGTRGADSNNDFFLGSNAYRVLTKSEIPVMTVRSDSPKLGYRHILLPIDSSEHSRQKVNAALQFANKFASHVHVLGVLGNHEEPYEYKMVVILSQIKKMAAAKKLSFTGEIIKTGERAKKTLAYSKKIGADLIITMTDQKTEFSKAILSTYVHELINNAKIPVLSIPPEIHNENIGQDSIGGMW